MNKVSYLKNGVEMPVIDNNVYVVYAIHIGQKLYILSSC